ncbi:hypothetical protein DF047_34640 [Burkholderia cenocepacia]|uniref:hypothetical protein n=1 Tax=Burkholderia cenocepacia TaxID=95486 RepID=UPI000F5C0FF2|nr:hypothetical protein [Burkholderia cenocepacia]RQU99443.1 hypothetical protein DF047_34640 [Burkholderia cenocepacia]
MATGNDRLSKIRDYLAAAEFTLMAREWRDVSSQYRFRCESGHAVDVHAELAHRGCGYFLGLIYVANPRLSRYSMGLR